MRDAPLSQPQPSGIWTPDSAHTDSNKPTEGKATRQAFISVRLPLCLQNLNFHGAVSQLQLLFQ